MTRNRAGLFLLALAMLSGCSAEPAAHAQCKDAGSTQEYSTKWQDALAEARTSGRLTVEQAVEAQGKAYGKLGLMKDDHWAEFCTYLDSVRNETGF